MSTNTAATESPILYTESAIKEVKRLLAEEQKKTTNNIFLRIGVKGGGCSGLSYIFSFDELLPNDIMYQFEDITFIVDQSHEMYLSGMTIDYKEGLGNRGFTFDNPNATKTCGCGHSFSA